MSVVSLVARSARRVLARITAREPNLVGDRDIEWSWIAGHIPPGDGPALDFGNGGSAMALAAAQRGYDVIAVDLEPVTWPYAHPRLRFAQGDMLTMDLEERHFDLVLSCSTVEHVGLAGRYTVEDGSVDGDLEVMARLHTLMTPNGRMLLTIPVGRDAVFPPLCRVYGEERLPRLLAGYDIEKEAFWVKDSQNRWQPADRQSALAFEAAAGSWTSLRNVYALGLFVLRLAE